MSYIIFQQWLKGSDRAAFPIVCGYAYNKEKFNRIDAIEQHHQKSISPVPSSPTSSVNTGKLSLTKESDSEIDTRPKKRKNQSIDRKRIRPNGGVLSIDGDSDDGIDSVDSSDTVVPDRVEQKFGESGTSQVIVDVHRRPVSDATFSDSDTSHRDDGTLRADQSSRAHSKSYLKHERLMLDINHNAMSNDDSSCSEISDIINERRQQFQRMSASSSSFSDDSTYATVELRHRVSCFLLRIFLSTIYLWMIFKLNVKVFLFAIVFLAE